MAPVVAEHCICCLELPYRLLFTGALASKAISTGCTCLTPILAFIMCSFDAMQSKAISSPIILTPVQIPEWHFPSLCTGTFPWGLFPWEPRPTFWSAPLAWWGVVLFQFLKHLGLIPSIQSRGERTQHTLCFCPSVIAVQLCILNEYSHGCYLHSFSSVSPHFLHGEQGFHYQQCPLLAALIFMAVLFYSQFCRVPSS